MSPYSEILFPVDFSERCLAAAPFVLSMARRWNASVTLLHVLHPVPAAYGAIEVMSPQTIDMENLSAEAQGKLREFAQEQLPKCNVSCKVMVGDAGKAIVEYSQTRYTGVIALPTHGYGPFKRLLLGSVTARVLDEATVPVWTTAHAPDPEHRAHPQPRHILCAIDLKGESRHVVDAATALAHDAGAKLEILHVAPEGEISAEERQSRLGHIVAEAAGNASVLVTTQTSPTMMTEDASVAGVVRETARLHRSDLIVIGRDRSHFAPGGIGSDTYKIIREAPCPVLSV